MIKNRNFYIDKELIDKIPRKRENEYGFLYGFSKKEDEKEDFFVIGIIYYDYCEFGDAREKIVNCINQLEDITLVGIVYKGNYKCTTKLLQKAEIYNQYGAKWCYLSIEDNFGSAFFQKRENKLPIKQKNPNLSQKKISILKKFENSISKSSRLEIFSHIPKKRTQQVIFDENLYKNIILSLGKRRKEIGGVLLGNYEENQANIVCAIFPPQSEQTPTYCEFLGENLNKIRLVIDKEENSNNSFPYTKIVGWIHTHPNIPIFLSETDKQTFLNWSRFDSQSVAIVIDPINQDRGAFNSNLEKIDFKLDSFEEIPSKDQKSLQKISEKLSEFHCITNRKILSNGYTEQFNNTIETIEKIKKKKNAFQRLVYLLRLYEETIECKELDSALDEEMLHIMTYLKGIKFPDIYRECYSPDIVNLKIPDKSTYFIKFKDKHQCKECPENEQSWNFLKERFSKWYNLGLEYYKNIYQIDFEKKIKEVKLCLENEYCNDLIYQYSLQTPEKKNTLRRIITKYKENKSKDFRWMFITRWVISMLVDLKDGELKSYIYLSFHYEFLKSEVRDGNNNS